MPGGAVRQRSLTTLHKNDRSIPLRQTNGLQSRDNSFRSKASQGGAPQGTLLGNYLFIAATDSLGKREQRATDGAVTRTQSALTHLQIERETRFFNADNTYESTPVKRRGILPLMNEANFSTPTSRGQFQSCLLYTSDAADE